MFFITVHQVKGCLYSHNHTYVDSYLSNSHIHHTFFFPKERVSMQLAFCFCPVSEQFHSCYCQLLAEIIQNLSNKYLSSAWKGQTFSAL